MSGFILSQAEINALMEQGTITTDSVADPLTDLMRPMLALLKKQLGMLLSSSVSIDGYYVDNVTEITTPIVIENAYVTPIQLKMGQSYIIVTESNAESLGAYLNIDSDQAFNLVSEEFASVFASFLSDLTGYWQSMTPYPANILDSDQVHALTGEPTYLAHYNIIFKDIGIEVLLLLEDSIVDSLIGKSQTKQPLKPRAKPQISKNKKLKSVKIQDFSFGELDYVAEDLVKNELNLVNDISMDVVAELGTTTMTLGDIMTLEIGNTIILEKSAGEPADVFVQDKSIAKAEVTIIDDRFGLRVLEIDPKKDSIIY